MEYSYIKEQQIAIDFDEDDRSNGHYIISPMSNKTPTAQLDTNSSLRLNGMNSGKNSKRPKLSLGGNAGCNTNLLPSALKKGSGCGDQSFHQSRQNNAACCTTSAHHKNQKQPLYSLVPDQINKNLSKEFFSAKATSNDQSIQMLAHKLIKKGTLPQSALPSNLILSMDCKNENNIMLCEESEIMTRVAGGGLLQMNGTHLTLTPQKNQPTPISPTQRPVLSNNTSGVNNMANNSKQPTCNIQSDYGYGGVKYKYASGGSDTKTAVQYNEFKYYTSGNEINQDNMKKYINISNSGVQQSRKSDIPQQQYELSPSENKIFDVHSPKNSISSSSMIRANSLRKQARVGVGYQENRNLQLNQGDSQKSDSQQMPLNISSQYECQIKELQEHIMQLEQDLKQSQQRNHDISKKLKEKSFVVQSFDKNLRMSKHLSDTEDSLILSEKKVRRPSLSGGPSINQVSKSPNFNVQQNQTQSTSSIVDVKIRPISNLKQQNVSPVEYRRRNSSSLKRDTMQIENQDNTDGLTYAVYDLKEESKQQFDSNDRDNVANDQDEDECEGCERLKQLVFQAKEAIDDLKGEIEEWRDICADKETELRQLHHRLYNDLVGVDKKIEFKEDVNTKEFDPSRPVNADSKRIKNFIQQNKKRIMSRSKNRMDKKLSSQFSGKKPILKNMKETIGNEDDVEFYEAEDQGIQTSFICGNVANGDYLTTSNDIISSRGGVDTSKCGGVAVDVKCHAAIGYNTNISSNLSPDKKENCMSNPYISDDKNTAAEDTQTNEELTSLRQKTFLQDQELLKLKQQVALLTKQCETFATLTTRIKRKVKKSQQPLTATEFQELKENYGVISQLESYSILEKINEWKREEGIPLKEIQMAPTQIPRPLKLILEIDQKDLEDAPTTSSIAAGGELKDQSKQSVNISPNSDFKHYIKHEQETLRKLQEMKFKELQRQQHEYLSYLKGIQ